MMVLEYFGTSLTNAGHYFWGLEREAIYSTRRQIGSLPFNPEMLPHRKSGSFLRNGTTEFYRFAGFSIMAIEGSCKDDRPGSKSIFFVYATIEREQLKDMILQTPIAFKIIAQMQFPVLW